jgi:hypothetical protein
MPRVDEVLVRRRYVRFIGWAAVKLCHHFLRLNAEQMARDVVHIQEVRAKALTLAMLERVRGGAVR